MKQHEVKLVALWIGLLASGCGSDSRETDAHGSGTDAGTTAAATADGGRDAEVVPDGGGATASLYVIANEIYAADDSTTYLNVIDTLDDPDLDPRKAIEFAGGRATVRAYAGWVFVNPPNSDVIERYVVSDAGKLEKDDEVGFGNFGFEDMYIDEWGNTFISEQKAYLFNTAAGEFVIWNPSTMEILGTVDQGDEDLIREGWDLDSSPGVVRDGLLFRAFYWNNQDTYTWSDEVYLAVYDIEHDTLIAFHEETRCPSLGNRIDRDEDDNLYFSNWIWNVGATLVHDAPKSCVLRVNAGEQAFDADWSFSYSDVAEGREGAMFAHLGGDEALVSIFHDEREAIDDETVGSELVSTPNWRMWHVDLASDEAAPLEGLDWNTGAISTYHVDGRSFLFVPGEDWSITKVYEIVDGEAVHKFDVQGWSYQMFKVR